MKRKKVPAGKGGVCSWCKEYAYLLKDGEKVWFSLPGSGYVYEDFESHSICPVDIAVQYVEMQERGLNPPVWAKDRKIWCKARHTVEAGYKGKKSPRDLYAVVSHVYKKMGGRVKRKARGNPTDHEWAGIVQLFEKWHDYSPTAVRTVRVESRVMPKKLVRLGDLEYVGYRSDKWNKGEKHMYHHAFKRRKPLLCASTDGRLWVVAGDYRITADGIIG